jgi:hypothetical protein
LAARHIKTDGLKGGVSSLTAAAELARRNPAVAAAWW